MLDRQLITALQVDGRASFRRIAEVLDTSDQTIARRYARLRAARRVRVLGLTEPHRLGEVSWTVRARTTPGAAVPIAEALARRPDTSWVSITSGGTEIACATRARDSQDADTLLLEKLPRTRRIVDVSAHALMHVFYGYAAGRLLKAGILSDDQLSALADGVPAAPHASGPDTAPVELDDIDRAVLDLLGRDGRIGLDELAARTNTPASTVRRRVNALRGNGVLYFDVDHDSARPGTTTLMWLTVAPRRVHDVGRALAQHPQVSFAAATTGRTNLYASVATANAAALYRYVTGPVADLPGVREVETAPVIRTVKRAGTIVPPA